MMDKNLRILIKKMLKEGYENHLNSTENNDLDVIERLKDDIISKLSIVYKKNTNKDLDLPKIVIKVDDSIKNGKIAGFNYPDNYSDVGVLGVKSKALKNVDYLRDIFTHELIHASIGKNLPDHVEHSGLFNKLAKGMGLPIERRD